MFIATVQWFFSPPIQSPRCQLIFVFFMLFFFSFFSTISVVIVSIGATKKEMRSLDVVTGSPKHRTSIVAASSLSVDTGLESECDISGASSHIIQHQPSLDQTTTTSKAAMTTAPTEPSEMISICAEPLEKILEHKLVKEKRLEMEKKMETMRKKHDKEKLRVSSQKSGDLTDGIRRSKFYMNNKLVKRLSSKNM